MDLNDRLQQEAVVSDDSIDDAAVIARLVGWIGQDADVAINALQHMKDSIQPLLENTEMRNREYSKAMAASTDHGYFASLAIVRRYCVDTEVDASIREFLRNTLIPHIEKSRVSE